MQILSTCREIATEEILCQRQHCEFVLSAYHDIFPEADTCHVPVPVPSALHSAASVETFRAASTRNSEESQPFLDGRDLIWLRVMALGIRGMVSRLSHAGKCAGTTGVGSKPIPHAVLHRVLWKESHSVLGVGAEASVRARLSSRSQAAKRALRSPLSRAVRSGEGTNSVTVDGTCTPRSFHHDATPFGTAQNDCAIRNRNRIAQRSTPHHLHLQRSDAPGLVVLLHDAIAPYLTAAPCIGNHVR